MNDWLPIETAPKDGTAILVFGKPDDTDVLCFKKSGAYTAYWDELDRSFCLSGATWLGPFISPTNWQPLPLSPAATGAQAMSKPARLVSLAIDQADSAIAVLKSLIAEKLHEDDRKDIDRLIERTRYSLNRASGQLSDARRAAEAALDKL